LPFYILCSKIQGTVKVVLNGEGADELFGGYPQYLQPTWRLAEMQRGLERVRDLELPISEGVLALVDRFSAAENSEDRLAVLFALNLADQLVRNHLEVVDKCAMAFGLEMRVPFLDDRVVELVRHFPHTFKLDAELSVGKYILKTAALRCFGTRIGGVVLRPKRMMPQACQQFFGQFARLCTERLSSQYVSRHELGTSSVRRPGVVKAPATTELVTFDLFRYIFIENRGVVPTGFDLVEFLDGLGA
jgi:asparagine synthase (glutamine-hydrolysing)